MTHVRDALFMAAAEARPERQDVPIRVAYGSVPKEGGTFTFYRNIRAPLAARGVDIRCVSVGLDQADLWNPRYADEGCVLLAPETANVRRQAQAFVEWCEANAIDIVIGINSPPILSAIPHLPGHIVAVARCANGFDHGYRITLAGGERIARIVALVPRLADDLVAQYGAPADKIALIPNGIDPAPFASAAARARGDKRTLRLGFLGRLEHNQKGVLHLPKILKALNATGVDVALRIAGQGKHEAELRAELAPEIASGLVEFVGVLLPGEVPDFLAATDVFLFTSHFEGCPNALLEALMAGAVPVSWRLPGITDFVVADGVTGLLVETYDRAAFAAAVAGLANDRERVAQMSVAATAAARACFSHARAAEAYAAVFREALAAREQVAPKPWSAFRVDENFSVSAIGAIRAMAKRTLRRNGLWRPA